MKSLKIFIAILLPLLSLSWFGEMVFGGSPVTAPAIKGYDPVAYFKEGKALKGSAAYSYQWHNLTWYFSTKNNRDQFTDNPGKYAPQYNGYCAWAMTEARKAATDPTVWEIYNGKLYLNCSRSAHEKWSRDVPGNIKKADANWNKFYSEE